MKKPLKMPLAKSQDIVIQKTENETLVYDMKTHKACSLNQSIAYIWENCDGKTDIEIVIKNLEENLKAKLDNEFVIYALGRLEKASLLEGGKQGFEFPTMNRRSLLRKYAITGLSLPIIVSLVAPTSAQMASCLTTGQTGCNTTPCCPNNTCQAIVGPGGIITNQCVATP